MATDAEVATPQQRPESEQEQHDFPWLRRDTDQPAPPSEQELHDFPWLKRQAEPQAQPQAAPINDDLIKSVVDAYQKTRSPLEWAEDVGKLSPVAMLPEVAKLGAKRFVETGAGILGEAARQAGRGVTAGGAAEAQVQAGVQVPDLQGKSVDQVKALREQMIAQSNDLSKRQDQIINSGTPDEYSLYGYLQAKQGLDQRIKEADSIIASGKPQAEPSGTTEPLAQGLNFYGRTVAPNVSQFLDKYVPTSQEFENSLPGMITKGGADAAALGVASVLGGPVGGAVAGGLMFGNQAYDDAKAHGASDDVADNASLLTGIASGTSLAITGPIIGSLAKNFAGLSAKQGMSALQQAFRYVGTRVAGTGGEFVVTNMEQNAIAKLTGYDPNRKLDAGNWQNFFTGVAFGTIHSATHDVPHIQKMFKADVTTRNKDGAPAQTGEQTQQPVTPAAGAQPTAPTTQPTVEQQATTAARTTATQTPEQTIAQANPEAELDKFMSQMGGQERGFVQVGGTPPTYTGPERPAPRPTLQLGGGERDAVAMPPAATEHGAEPVPSNTPGPPTTVPAPQTRAPERVVAAAVRQGDVIGEGVNHAAAIEDLNRKGGRLTDEQVDQYYQTGVHAGAEYGFTTSDGRFVDREEARRISGAKGAEAIHMVPQEAGKVTSQTVRNLEAEGFEGVEDTPEGRARLQAMADEETHRSAELVYDQIRHNQGQVTFDEFRRQVGELAPEAHLRQLWEGFERDKRGVPEGATAEHPEPQPENNSPQREAWYESADFANLPPVARPEPEDARVGPADVKREVNTAQAQMGMEDHLHYVANVEALPAHVKSGLTEGERANTAQIVRDNKLGNIYVIGDRFDSLNDLRRKIVEETLPYHYRNVTKVGLTHDPTDPRTGHYDLMSDRPILNTHAIISQDRPYEEASRALMEEADVHQGISKLLGPRNGVVYTQVMGQLLQQFRRLGLVDKLAQLRGYENAQHMAQAYGTPKWETDPRQGNKFTEELAAGWSRNFRNADELMRDGPSWWQNGLRQLNNGIRQFMGIRLSDYDVQKLLVDSAAALRRPKWDDHESEFHPIGNEAKADMRDFQMASLPPEKTATEAGETADIGTELVKGKIRNLKSMVGAGQGIRAGALKQALDNTHGVQERMNLLNRQPAIYTRAKDGELMQAGKQMFNEDFGGSVHAALDYLTENARSNGPEPNNQALVEVTDRETDRQIEQLDQAGRTDEANILRAKLDRMNEEQLARQTKSGQEISAIRLRRKTGSSAIAEHKERIQAVQENGTEGSEGKRVRRQKTTEALGKVKEATEAAAKSLRDRYVAMATKYGITDLTKSLPEQYTDDLVNRMREQFANTGTETDTRQLAPVEQVFDTFRRNIADIIREKDPKPPTTRMQISPASTLNEIMTNYSWYGEAWARTIQDLNEHNPALAQRFADVVDHPIGEPLANKLAAEQGTKLSDLIYNHYATNDRLSADLARDIASKTDIHPQMAEGLAVHLNKLFGDIVKKEQGERLQSILDSVGGTDKPAKSELERLLNHITIGGLDSKEWLNLVAPRFGLEHYTPEDLDSLRSAGNYLALLRDYGLANTAVAQNVRTIIGDITTLSNIDPASRKAWEQVRYISDVYTSSILTNPLTHIPYWQQNVLMGSINSLIHGMREVRRIGDWNVIGSQIMAGLDGLARGMREFVPTLQGGYKPQQEFEPTFMGAMHRGPLERTEFDWQKPGSWFSRYKYVRNFLEATSNLMTRGGQYAVHQALALHLAWDKGLSGQKAYDYASELVLGTKEQQAEADRLSHQWSDELNAIDPAHQIDEPTRRMLREQLLDQLKTTTDNPDSAAADQESQRLLDAARRSQIIGARGALRGDVYGMWGKLARGLVAMTGENPEAKAVVPFINIPFNFINELMSWSPIGVMRSIGDFTPEDSQWKSAISKASMIPVIGYRLAKSAEGIRGYIKDVPGMEAKMKSGEFSEEAIRDLAWEQMVKGITGMGVFTALGVMQQLLLKNPNPPWQFTYNGPSAYNAQQAEKGKGWMQHAVHLGDWAGPLKGWHSYENTPLRAVFAALGSYEDYIRYDSQDPAHPANAGTAALRLMNGGVSSIFGSPLQGLETVLRALTSSGGAQDAQRQLGNFITQVVGAAATVPVGGSASRAIYRLFDPTEYEANDYFGKAVRYIPVVNHMLLAPKLNIFGEAMRASPMEKVSEYSPTSGIMGTGLGGVINANDPVWHYLDTHPGIRLSLPGATGSVAGIRMTPDEIRVYHEARGPQLKKEIAQAINTPSFRAMPVDEQNYQVHHIYEPIANRIGQAAVIRYRQEHPVTPERRAQSRIGQLQAMRQEQQSVSVPEE